jgi:hypothetical protein
MLLLPSLFAWNLWLYGMYLLEIKLKTKVSSRLEGSPLEDSPEITLSQCVLQGVLQGVLLGWLLRGRPSNFIY